MLAPDHTGNWIAVWRSSNGITVDLQYATLNVFQFIFFLHLKEAQGYWLYSPNRFLNSNSGGIQGGSSWYGVSVAFNGTFAIAGFSFFFELLNSILVWETDYFDSQRYYVNSRV